MKKLVFSMAAAVMLMQAPAAYAGYWTGHAEIIRTIIENWILQHQQVAQDQDGARQSANTEQSLRPKDQQRQQQLPVRR